MEFLYVVVGVVILVVVGAMLLLLLGRDREYVATWVERQLTVPFRAVRDEENRPTS